MSLSQYLLLGIVIVIPVVGFISTLGYARKADTMRGARWRKRHGIFFWVIIPTLLGLITFLGTLDFFPSVVALIGIILFACTTLWSWLQQRKHEG